jgi:hypothetical protein
VRAPIDRETVSPAFIAEVLVLQSLEAGDNFATYESMRPEAMNGSGNGAGNAPGTGNL